VIEARGLTVRLGGRDVVAGVSFALDGGDALGIVGESGSGKSTLLRALAGLETIAGGSLLIDGAPALPGARERGRITQLVFQDPYGSLHPRHSVARALGEPIAIHRLGDADARIDRALEEVGLGRAFRFRYPHQLSGGQRQRVAIARALILAPRLVLLDEPTASLDALARAEIVRLLAALRHERGVAYLLVSHDLAIVRALAGRVAVMQEGRIVERLSSTDLTAAGARHPHTQALLAASRGFRRVEHRVSG
jgi:peptide/nickel transport system ATP-binding protein